MALCTLCYQSQNAHPVPELPPRPEGRGYVQLCKGCAYQLTRMLNYLGTQGIVIQWGSEPPVAGQRALEPDGGWREDVGGRPGRPEPRGTSQEVEGESEGEKGDEPTVIPTRNRRKGP